MVIQVNDLNKTVEIWLSIADRKDHDLQNVLKPIYAEYKQKGYLAAVFLSGDQDLYEQTIDLLKFNRKRSAQREVQQEKLDASTT